MSPPRTENKTLVLAFVDNQPDVSLEELNDWCDNEHVPPRLAVPGITSAARYVTEDGEKPEWLTLYDFESPEVLQSEAYLNLAKTASAKEREVVSRLPVLQRRVYSLVAHKAREDKKVPSAYLGVVLWYVPEDKEEDYHRWYDEEHMDDMSKQPGWCRGRRYKLLDCKDLVPRPGPPEHNQIVFHDFENGDWWQSPDLGKMLASPSGKRVVENAKIFAIRRYKLYKAY